MPTITQLPAANSVSASDLIPVSQGGSVHSVSVGALLAQTQPAIMVAPPSLLGRTSMGPGGPDAIAIGAGLTLSSGTLGADSLSLNSLPVQTSLSIDDQLIVSSAGAPQLVGVDQVRNIFSGGSNISIDTNGVISAMGVLDIAPRGIGELPAVASLASGDLIAVSQNNQDHTVTYSALLDGLTIDLAQPASAASDSDTFWVAQASNVMLRQSVGTLWPWISGKLTSWMRPVIELNADTTLDGTLHNNAILVCGNPILISAPAAGLGSGFSSDLMNVSSGMVTFSSNIMTSTGANNLPPAQCGSLRCVTYSGGTVIFASFGSGGTATSPPGQVSNLTTSSLASTGITLAWSPPTSGGPVSTYTVQYRINGTTTWLLAGQTSTSLNLPLSGLLAVTAYDFIVTTANSAGPGPASSIFTVSTLASAQSPGAPTGVTVTNVTATGLTCSWTAPIVAGADMVYQVQYRISGQSNWNSAASNLSATTFNMTGLAEATTYQIQVTASDANGSGPPSSIVSGQTTAPAGLVTSVTWNMVPAGNYTAGVGTIGVNVHVTPGTAPVQFGFSTSSTTPPISWVAAINVNTDLWGQYVPTPGSAGTWYAWVEGSDGSGLTVYPTSFTVT